MKFPKIELEVCEVRVDRAIHDVTRCGMDHVDVPPYREVVAGGITYTARTVTGLDVTVDANTADRLMRQLMGTS